MLTDEQVNKVLIDCAKSFGTHYVIPNDKQLIDWTITLLCSGDPAIIKRCEELIKNLQTANPE